MKFVGKLAKEWERVSQHFMKKLVGKWTISAYSTSGDLHSKGKVLIAWERGNLIANDITMKLIKVGKIDHVWFRRRGESFVVPVNEVTLHLRPSLVKGDTYIILFSMSVSGI